MAKKRTTTRKKHGGNIFSSLGSATSKAMAMTKVVPVLIQSCGPCVKAISNAKGQLGLGYKMSGQGIKMAGQGVKMAGQGRCGCRR